MSSDIYLAFQFPVIPIITLHLFPITLFNFMQLNETTDVILAPAVTLQEAEALAARTPARRIVMEGDVGLF